jgi:hypothetical protein
MGFQYAVHPVSFAEGFLAPTVDFFGFLVHFAGPSAQHLAQHRRKHRLEAAALSNLLPIRALN